MDDETIAVLEHAMQNGRVAFTARFELGTYTAIAHTAGASTGRKAKGDTMLDAMLAAYRNLYPEGT